MSDNVFESDAFSLKSLTAAINEVEYTPRRLGELGIFEASGITTTQVVIEKDGDKLALVESKPRGAPGTVVGGSRRSAIPFMTAHLPTTATILADEVQGVRAFGTEDTAEQLQTVINGRLAKMARRIDITHEYHRIGAVKGLVLDADGKHVLYDLFKAFGMEQIVIPMALDAPGTDLQGKSLDILEAMEEGLGDLFFDGGRVLCGQEFWRMFVTHKSVKAAFERFMEGEKNRSDLRTPFYFGGLFWERYRGTVNGEPFVASKEAYAMPMGSDDLFISRFAPGDYMDTVNTLGLPFYSSSKILDHNKGVELEAQSNPAHLNTRPKSCIKLVAGGTVE
ncbi:major capsid protein [Halomonas sp. HMF6819]|uniref:major capsid protein n=1 Tax=Halomonas sp. HMF6819 TaxID=3373085 RepID=UPI00379F8E7E